MSVDFYVAGTRFAEEELLRAIREQRQQLDLKDEQLEAHRGIPPTAPLAWPL